MPLPPGRNPLRVLFAVAWSAAAGPIEPHPLRERLLALIRRLPGIRFSNVWKEARANRGTAKYHIQMLERAEEIQAVREKGVTRFYAKQVDATEQQVFAVLWRGRVLEVVRFILEHPSIGQAELTERLDISRKVLRGYVDLLVEQGLLQEDRGPHSRNYLATSKLVRVVDRLDRGHEGGNTEMGHPAPGGEDRR